MTVVDASVLVEVLLRTRAGQALSRRVLRSGETLHGPHLIDIEVAHAIRRATAKGDIAVQRGHDALADLIGFPLRRYRHDVLLPRIWELRANVTAYDGAYVALAELLDAPLLTCDGPLARSSGHRARIELA
ncbi:MAG: type II toxin-antitoxin system VapC family toxin [Sphingomonadales bacterium]